MSIDFRLYSESNGELGIVFELREGDLWRNTSVGACGKTRANWSQKARGDAMKAWARAAAGTPREDAGETLCEDRVAGLEFLGVGKEEGWAEWPVCRTEWTLVLRRTGSPAQPSHLAASHTHSGEIGSCCHSGAAALAERDGGEWRKRLRSNAKQLVCSPVHLVCPYTELVWPNSVKRTPEFRKTAHSLVCPHDTKDPASLHLPGFFFFPKQNKTGT